MYAEFIKLTRGSLFAEIPPYETASNDARGSLLCMEELCKAIVAMKVRGGLLQLSLQDRHLLINAL
jgi:hypothetical protein